MAEPSRTATRTPLFSRKSAIAVLGVASFAFLLVLYMSGKGGKNAPVDPACLGTAKIAARLQPLVRGEIAALTLASSSKLLPELSFTAPGGTARLANFKGRTV
ncbi:MAG: hypothetical protein J2P49_09275, partial [Methylocapsa sp.]|nr:hypothetical protein [Methylocapsa sp.]